MALQDILNAIADRTPFVTEAQRDEIKAQIAKLGTNTESENLGQDTESQETTETPASGNEQGTTEETESSTVVGTTEPPAPETGPVTEVGMGIVPEPPVTFEEFFHDLLSTLLITRTPSRSAGGLESEMRPPVFLYKNEALSLFFAWRPINQREDDTLPPTR